MRAIEIYENKAKRNWLADNLMHRAKHMLAKAKIVGNLDQAYILSGVIELRNASKKQMNQKEIELHMGLHRILTNCYEHITDEVAIISAFELYAKSKLLKRQYVIHEITKPNNTKRQQNNSPLHLKTYFKNKNTQNEFCFSNKSLSASVLLSRGYEKKYNLSQGCIEQLKKFNATRNLVHLQFIHAYTVSRPQLDAIIELKNAIKKYT